MKIILSLVVIGCSIAIGMNLSAIYSRRINDIDSLILSLTLLQNEIKYSKAPLDSAFKKVCKDGPFYICADALKKNDGLPFSEKWTRSVEEYFKSTPMHIKEKEILLELGSFLGRSDIDGQEKAICLTIEKLRSQRVIALSEKERHVPVIRNLSISLGIFAVILMI